MNKFRLRVNKIQNYNNMAKKNNKTKKTMEKKQEIAKEGLVTPTNSLIIDIKTDKVCPICKVPLSSSILYNTEVDYCPKCYGLWFEDQELRLAKDERDKTLRWLDIDIWKDEKKFKVAYGIRVCPSCRVPLYEVYYGKSRVIVDVCRLCKGIWLDRAEFKKIIEWLQGEANYRIINKYAQNFFEEAVEVFIGPETLREEILDFLAILKLLNYKFCIQHPAISRIISQLPK